MADEYDCIMLWETATEWELEGTRTSPEASCDAIRLVIDKATFLMKRCAFSLVSGGGYFK